MATAVTNTTINTTSMFNTPQAVDDSYTLSEDAVVNGSGSGSGWTYSGGILTMDVMANDLGGSAKQLWSVTDQENSGPITYNSVELADLVSQDANGTWESANPGAQVRLQDGKLQYQMSDALRATIDKLGAGETYTDVISYAIRLANGTLSVAEVKITIVGMNDAPEAADATKAGSEDATITGTVTSTDKDDGASASYSVVGTPPAGFALNADGSYSLDASDAAYQHIAAGEHQDVVVTYQVADGKGGTDTATLTITVNGVNDAPEAADATKAGSEDTTITGTVTSTDKDDGASAS
ncbi:MAG: VCBS domain-containing protein, partial [Pseudomonadota bacterium]